MSSKKKSVTFLKPWGGYNPNESVFLPTAKADNLVIAGRAKLTNEEDTVEEDPLPDPLEMLRKEEAQDGIENLDTEILRKIAKDIGIGYTAQKGHDRLVEDLIDAGYTPNTSDESEDNAE